MTQAIGKLELETAIQRTYAAILVLSELLDATFDMPDKRVEPGSNDASSCSQMFVFDTTGAGDKSPIQMAADTGRHFSVLEQREEIALKLLCLSWCQNGGCSLPTEVGEHPRQVRSAFGHGVAVSVQSESEGPKR